MFPVMSAYSFKEMRERRRCDERVKGELTALHLIAHISTVVPAITLQLIRDAHAGLACKLFGASCSHCTEEKEKNK